MDHEPGPHVSCSPGSPDRADAKPYARGLCLIPYASPYLRVYLRVARANSIALLRPDPRWLQFRARWPQTEARAGHPIGCQPARAEKGNQLCRLMHPPPRCSGPEMAICAIRVSFFRFYFRFAVLNFPIRLGSRCLRADVKLAGSIKHGHPRSTLTLTLSS